MSKEQSTPTLKKYIEKLETARAIGHMNLTLVPLRGEGGGQLDYILSEEAIAAGTLTVTEVSESGSVPELLAENASDRMVLLLDGEELVGAKQNRILNTTVLLKANSKTKIPVSCVEQGRWSQRSTKFSVGSYSPSNIRASKSKQVAYSLAACGVAHSDQGAIWDEVGQSMYKLRASSPTMAMHDAVEQRRESIDSYIKALKYPKESRGVIAAINGRFVAADVFDKAATLKRVWPRLITGYALDALGRKGKKGRAFTAKGATALLEHLGEIECRPCPSVGMGKDWRFEAEDVLGQALIVEKTSVHLSVFPNAGSGEGRQTRTRRARIVSPSRRRRSRQEDHRTSSKDSPDTLLSQFSPLVREIAERLARKLPKEVDLDDLISAGTFGLMDAIEAFEPNRGIEFETYCKPRIRGAILDELRSMDWVPRLARGRARKLTETNLSSDPESNDPLNLAHRRDIKSLITKGFSRAEQLIITMYYYEEMTMKDIAAKLDLSEARVSKIHASILERLKKKLHDLGQEQGTESA